MKISSPVKHFIWRAANELLPTQMNLFCHKISDKKLCPICGLVEETLAHTLWECPATNDVWSETTNALCKWQLSQVVLEIYGLRV